MDIRTTLARQVGANLPKIWASPHFVGERMWLTLYLVGLEEPLGRIAETLATAGWQNTGGSDGGHIYPCLEVDQTVDAVMKTALWVQSFCERHTIISGIDADTLPNNTESRIITLYESEIGSRLLSV